jgi:hypothetical protein
MCARLRSETIYLGLATQLSRNLIKMNNDACQLVHFVTMIISCRDDCIYAKAQFHTIAISKRQRGHFSGLNHQGIIWQLASDYLNWAKFNEPAAS